MEFLHNVNHNQSANREDDIQIDILKDVLIKILRANKYNFCFYFVFCLIYFFSTQIETTYEILKKSINSERDSATFKEKMLFELEKTKNNILSEPDLYFSDEFLTGMVKQVN